MNPATTTAQPYAEALIELANSTDQVKHITKDLLSVSDLLSNSKTLKLFLANPVIGKTSKKIVLSKLLKTQVNNIVLTFLYLLLDKHRIVLLDDIISRYIDLSNELKKTLVVHLKTAQILTNDQYNMLENKIRNMTRTKTVKIVTHVDSTIIAGLILQIGSKIIDTSLRGQLEKMASHLSSTEVLA